MTLRGEGVLVHDVLQLHCQQTLADYSFLWLNKSRYASSSVKICILVTASCVKHYVAKRVQLRKKEAVEEAQVCMNP